MKQIHYEYTPWNEIKHDSRYILTVYILTYNHENTISKTIESVIKQKTTYPYRVIILEDCSSDKTLEICENYRNQYPDLINIVAQPINTKAEHSRWAKNSISTKYWTTVEGDDYWVDDDKIQIMIDFLEENQNIVGVAHDTLCQKGSLEYSLYNKERVERINNEQTHLISYERFQYVHTSSVIYRHIFDFKNYKLPLIDTYILYYYLSYGPILFFNKIMSVHPMTGFGIWSSLKNYERKYRNEYIHYDINRSLSYRFDTVFSATVKHKKQLKLYKRLFGIQIGWWIYITHRKISFNLKKITCKKD